MRYLLILVGEEELENLTVGNNWMPAHPGHPALQPLHAHFDKLFLKTPWNRDEDKKDKFNLHVYFSHVYLVIKVKHLPVTCLSGKDGMGIADPNLSRSLSYSQSKCLYLWLTGRFVFCKPITGSYRHSCKPRKISHTVQVVLLPYTPD